MSLEPSPIVGNPDIAKVHGATKPVQPDLGHLIQGYFSGNVKAIRGALKRLSSDGTKALEAGIAKAKSQRAKVSMADYAFTNWKAGQDYTSARYDQR